VLAPLPCLGNVQF